jgi:hypothetical protein
VLYLQRYTVETRPMAIFKICKAVAADSHDFMLLLISTRKTISNMADWKA